MRSASQRVDMVRVQRKKYNRQLTNMILSDKAHIGKVGKHSAAGSCASLSPDVAGTLS